MDSKVINGICYDINMNIVYAESNLTEIVLQEGVKNIEADAFNCYNCKTITIPSTVKYIDNAAFNELDSLEEVIVDKNNPFFSVKDGILYNKDKSVLIFSPPFNKNKTIVIPEETGIINDYAFWSNVNLEEVIMSNVKIIRNHAFCHCENLKKVDMGKKVTKICDNAFFECKKLSDIKFSNCLVDIQDEAFCTCTSLVKVVLPNTLQKLGQSAFSGCKTLKLIDIPTSLKTISDFAFYDCEQLEKLVIPDNITSIGAYTFGYCYLLSDIKLSNSIGSIGNNAFFNCLNLHNITIPKSVEKIGDSIFGMDNVIDNLTIYIPTSVLDKNPKFAEEYSKRISQLKTLDMLLDEGYNFKEANDIIKTNINLDNGVH